MKQVAQNYRSGELVGARRAGAGLQAGRRAGALAVLADLHRHRDDEGHRGAAVAARQGAGPPGPGHARCSTRSRQQGPVATYKKAINKLDSYTPLGYSLCGVVVEVGAGAEEFAVGDARRRRRQRVRAARRGQLGADQPVRAGARRRRAPSTRRSPPSARSRCRASAGPRSQLGETACVIGLGLVGQLVVRLLVAAGVRVVGHRHRRGALPARRGGRRAARAPRPTTRAPPTSSRSSAPAHRRPRRRPRLPRRRRRLQRAGRARRPPGPRPRPRRRHRQDPARPAVERLLREGARRPVLALLRARAATTTATSSRASTTRPATCAGPSAATSSASSTCSPAARSTSQSLVSGIHPDRRRRRRSTSSCATGALRGVGFLLRVPPARGAATTRSPTTATAALRRHAGRRRPRPAPHGAAVRIGFIGAGNYATSMLLPHLAKHPARRAGHGRHDHGRSRRSTPSASSASRRRRTDADAVLDDPSHRRRLRRHPAPLARGLRLPRARAPARPCSSRSRWRSPSEQLDAHPRRRSSATGNDRLMVGLQPPLRAAVHRTCGSASAPSDGPVSARYLVNAGPARAGSWYLNEELEGSRFLGEGGHFIDTLSWWFGARPGRGVRRSRRRTAATCTSTLRFADGSLGDDHLRHRRQPRASPRRPSTSPAAAATPGSTTSPGPPCGRRGGKDAKRVADRPGQGPARRSSAAFVDAVRDRCADADRARLARRHHPRDHRGRAEPRLGQAGDPVSRLASAGTSAGCAGCRPARWSSRASRPGSRTGAGRDRQVRPGDAAHPAGGPAPRPGVRRRPAAARPGRSSPAAAARRAGRRRRPAAAPATGGCSACRRPDIVDPDWFLDPVTGRRAPHDRAGVPHRPPGRGASPATSSRSGSSPATTTSPCSPRRTG